MDNTNHAAFMVPQNQSGGHVILQPAVINIGYPFEMSRKNAYPNLKVIPIQIFSSACVILGIASIGIQVK